MGHSLAESSQDLRAHTAPPLAITDGEINFFWSFIQGSIMIPDTWRALLRGYGFCERHAWIHLGMEMAFREQYLLGPTILYAELIDKALHALQAAEKVGLQAAARRLRAVGPCFVCAQEVHDKSGGTCPQARLDRGRDCSHLREIAEKSESLWRTWLCPDCSGRQSNEQTPNHCRRHLLAAAKSPASGRYRRANGHAARFIRTRRPPSAIVFG